MPFYDYKCTKCNNISEHLRNYNAPNPKCPACGFNTKRLIGTPMVKVYDSTLAEKQKDLSTYVY